MSSNKVNENLSYQNSYNESKAALRREFIALSVNIRKEQRSK